MTPEERERAQVLADVLSGMNTEVSRTRGFLVYRIGRRGVALLFFALLDLVYCYSLLFPDSPSQRSASVRYLAAVAPLWLWAILWGVAGVLCLFYAFRLNDRIGFAAAICVKTMWGILMMSAAAIGHVDRAYISGTIWLCMAGWLGVIASWPEPPVLPRHRRVPPHENRGEASHGD